MLGQFDFRSVSGDRFQSQFLNRYLHRFFPLLDGALYGLKLAGNSWRNTLAAVIKDLGFTSTRADADVWIQPAVKENGHEYYEMLLVYMDDILCISHQAEAVLKELGMFCKIKDGSLKKLDIYLGMNIKEEQMKDGMTAWSTSPRDYVNNAVKTVESLLVEDGEGYTLKNNAKNPFPNEYKPELDVTDELPSHLVSHYLQLIGIARWMGSRDWTN